MRISSKNERIEGCSGSHQGFASILQCYLTKKGKAVSAVCKYPQSLVLRTGSPRARVCMLKKGKLLLRRPALLSQSLLNVDNFARQIDATCC